jgi:hypothetical protein
VRLTSCATCPVMTTPRRDDLAGDPWPLAHSGQSRWVTSRATLEMTVRGLGLSTCITTRSLCTVNREVAVLRKQSFYTWSGPP